MINVLVTGSTGFVGQNLLPYFYKNGISIDTLDRTKNNSKWAENAFSWNNLAELNFSKYDAIVHLTGKAHDVKKLSDDSAYFEINTELSKKLAQQALVSGFKGKFLFLSSVKAAKDIVKGVLKETDTPEPATAYGKSKLQAEIELQKLLPEQLYTLRPCMIHGPGNKGNLNLLYTFVKKGIPYPLKQFKNKRSLLSVENLAFCMLKIINGDIPVGTYHLSDDGTVSTYEIVETIAKALGKPVFSPNVPKALVSWLAKTGDYLPLPLNSDRLQKLTENYIVDNSKIKAVLGESFPLTLEQGLLKTIKSFE